MRRPAGPLTILIIAVAVGMAVTAPTAGARRAPLHRCPPMHVADHQVRARVQFVSCRTADRLILAWRRRLREPHEHCIPRGDGFGTCTVDHWSFACQQTPNGHFYPVTAIRDRGLFKFDYPV
ncbi:MAG TPA: hypothetical protein VHO06_01955 [Polyangia bacterium]|nr:hypothetical protein [Polyangia bacterium]